jgi:transposase-like protein
MSDKNKGGRPSKLTPELREEIVSLIKTGNFIEMTCAIAGINKSTFYDWMRRGKESKRHTRYKKFYNEVTQAQAWSEARDVAIISKHAETSWRAAAWKLERRFSQRWGKTKTKKEEKRSIKVKQEDNVISINSPFTTLKNHENRGKRDIKNLKVKKCVKIKNY